MPVYSIGEHTPQLHESVYLAPGACVIGKVTIGAGSSVWFNCVVRGDVDTITIGEDTNIQDLSVCHIDAGKPLVMGDRVTVGHQCVIHGCIIEDDCLIGMGAIVMDNVEIASDCLVAAGSVLPPGKKYLQPGSMILGSPGRIVRALSEEEIASILQSAGNYQNYVAAHRGSGGQAEGAGDSWVR